jgi:hypothetical protein
MFDLIDFGVSVVTRFVHGAGFVDHDVDLSGMGNRGCFANLQLKSSECSPIFDYDWDNFIVKTD